MFGAFLIISRRDRSTCFFKDYKQHDEKSNIAKYSVNESENKHVVLKYLQEGTQIMHEMIRNSSETRIAEEKLVWKIS